MGRDVQQTRVQDIPMRTTDGFAADFNLNRTNAVSGFKMKIEMNNFASPESPKAMTMGNKIITVKNPSNNRSDSDGPQSVQA
jgi:hypothetical protein